MRRRATRSEPLVASVVAAPLVIAHRGASAFAPENTEAAVKRALRMRCDAVECDVQLARDGVPVVFHDANLRRLCGDAKRVDALSSRELLRRNVRVPGRTGAPARIVTLAHWLRLLPIDVLPVVELKRQRSAAAETRLARATARVVEGAPRRPLAVISFSPRLVAAARRALPHARTAPIRDARLSARERTRLVRTRDSLVVMSHRCADARTVDALRRAGKEVWCYTVDTPTRMKTLLARGVTGLISNRPDLARRVVDADSHAPVSRARR